MNIPSNVIEGCNILARYYKEPEGIDYDGNCYSMPATDETMRERDFKRMHELGWRQGNIGLWRYHPRMGWEYKEGKNE